MPQFCIYNYTESLGVLKFCTTGCINIHHNHLPVHQSSAANFTHLTETFHPFISYYHSHPQPPLPWHLEAILLFNCRSLLILIVCVIEVWCFYSCVWLMSPILGIFLATLTAYEQRASPQIWAPIVCLEFQPQTPSYKE